MSASDKALAIIIKSAGDDDEPQQDVDDVKMGMEMVAQDLIDAVKAGDAGRVAEALMMAHDMCGGE
jgi:hypothetical protein